MRYKSLNEEDVEIYRIDRRGYVLAASGTERVEQEQAQEQAQVEYRMGKEEKRKSEEELDIIDKVVKKILKGKPKYTIRIRKYEPVMVEGE